MNKSNRRHFCKTLGAGLATLGFAGSALADFPRVMMEPAGLNPLLLKRARTALDRHSAQVVDRNILAIADFDAPSRTPRFHIVDLISGETTSLLVAHGKGSDLAHSGYVHQFSNIPGSEATSAGAYILSERYVGQHGASRRLIGLDPENDQAEGRAIVIHSAWYVSDAIAAEHGKIGRSQGCFAFSENDIVQVLERLGPGTLLYADKV
jgi:L,D-transpeptidase catalytic domain